MAQAQAQERQANYEQRQNMELQLAQMENRLRGAISELVNPTIQRTSLVVGDVEAIKNLLSQHTRALQEVQLGQFKAMEQVSTIASFKEEMSRWDMQRRGQEAGIDEKVEAMQQKLDAYNYSLEQKESALHHLHRSVDRIATELNHILEEHESQRENFEVRLDEQKRKNSQYNANVEVRLAGIELRHNALTDEVWGEETGLAKVAGELKKTNIALGTLEADVAALQAGKAEAAQLDTLRTEVGKLVHEANSSVTAMRQTVGNVVNDVREHFRTASQTIAAHNATFIAEVREQYQDELASAAKLRGEVQDFVAGTAKNIAGLDDRVAEAAAKAGALAVEAREEVEELNKRRKRDKTSSDNELKALKKRLGGVFDTSDAVSRGIEHIYGVMEMMLQSDLIACSVEVQDSLDRKRIALMGVKDDETVLARTTQPEPQRPRPECRGAKGGSQKALGGMLRGGPGDNKAARNPQEPPIVRVDNRCLSCSGQAPLVLSAFKMACLQYSPSPVDHGGSQHDRSDLLEQRRRLLQSAHGALVDAPNSNGKPPGPSHEHGTGAEGDAFSDYAQIEARFSKDRRSSGMATSPALRLPSLAVAVSPRALTVR